MPPPVARFLLTSRQDVRAIVEQQRRTRVDTLQICDRLVDGTYAELRAAVPDVRIVQVIHVTGPESVDEAVLVAPEVDALLLGSGDQRLEIKQLGAPAAGTTGRSSLRIREAVDVPLFLAGGLNASERRARHPGRRPLRPRHLQRRAHRRRARRGRSSPRSWLRSSAPRRVAIDSKRP